MTELRIPDLVGSVASGLQARNALIQRKYEADQYAWEDEQKERQRKQWEASDNAIIKEKQARLVSDAEQIYSRLDPDAPGFEHEFDIAADWFSNRNPEGAEMVTKIKALNQEQRKAFIKQARIQINLAKPNDYTLKPGEVRFDQFGSKIADGGLVLHKLGPGQEMISSDGKTVIKGPPPAQPKPEQKRESSVSMWIREQKRYKKGSREWNFYQKKLEGPVAGVKPSGVALSHSDEILAKKLAAGKITTKQLTKRGSTFNAIVARAYEINSEMDLVVAEADEKLMGNNTFRMKKNMAESLYEILDDLNDAGKKMNFNRVSTIGKGQAAVRSYLNDPEYRYYMSLRNDAVQTLTNVMRGVGMSDKSVELELESMPESMNPVSFDAWYRGQMKALEPRLKFYKNVESKNKNSSGMTNNDAYKILMGK